MLRLPWSRRSYENGLSLSPPRRLDWRFWLLAGAAALALIAGIFGLVYFHNTGALDDSDDARTQLIEVAPGDSAGTIAAKLDDSRLIRSQWAFKLYARLHRSVFLPGRYLVSSAQPVPGIINVMVEGKSSVFNVTFIAGLTLEQLKQRLISQYGYHESEVDRAFKADYDNPLLADRPTGASLEGYIFPETFKVNVDDSLEELLGRDFSELYSKLTTDHLIAKFRQHHLTVYQALTLASIVQKEASDPHDQRLVAQVFLKRLKEGKPLGSDVTALYGADKAGVKLPKDPAAAASVAIKYDSPYNTRLHKGLPPGPIANMEYTAIEAVANPADTDYTYFIGGDDKKMHYARTLEEHNANINRYCQVSCR
ncbi:MAG TPA: endolytic transglycosylase MltG [Candidatus Saccharimonadales bacterium]|nr:endolytic transglycosylase MltG [Candidatus Saccharimonadales bacterium]